MVFLKFAGTAEREETLIAKLTYSTVLYGGPVTRRRFAPSAEFVLVILGEPPTSKPNPNNGRCIFATQKRPERGRRNATRVQYCTSIFISQNTTFPVVSCGATGAARLRAAAAFRSTD